MNSDVTFAAWVRLSSLPASGVAFPLISSNVSSYNNYWIILDCVNISGANYLAFEKYDGTNNPGARVTVTLSTGIWYRVVGTKIGNTLSIYLNGLLLGTATDTTASIPSYSDCDIGYAYGPGGRFLNGSVQGARIDSRGWTTQEVAADYNNSGFFTPVNRLKRKLSNLVAAVSNFFFAFFNQ